MTTFAARMAEAALHEQAVLNEIRCRGWIAEPFGQGQLPERVRDLLRKHSSTLVRWMPDIIAMKQFPNGMQLRFVDAKAGNKWETTGNHDVEIKALESADAFYSYAKAPVYFVFTDMGAAAPEDIWDVGWQGPNYGNGSGTPYLLFPAAVCRPLDATFGPVTEAA